MAQADTVMTCSLHLKLPLHQELNTAHTGPASLPTPVLAHLPRCPRPGSKLWAARRHQSIHQSSLDRDCQGTGGQPGYAAASCTRLRGSKIKAQLQRLKIQNAKTRRDSPSTKTTIQTKPPPSPMAVPSHGLSRWEEDRRGCAGLLALAACMTNPPHPHPPHSTPPQEIWVQNGQTHSTALHQCRHWCVLGMQQL